jgi:hypothetical protein
VSTGSTTFLERLKPLGPPFFGLVIACGLFVAYIYPAMHHRGQYGLLEIVDAVCSFIVLLGIFGFIAVFIIGLWQILAQQQQAWPAKYYIPVVLIAAYFTFKYSTGLMQGTAVNLWMTTPYGLTYHDVVDRYDDLCTVEVQDDEHSGHAEDDWHAGKSVCGGLSYRLRGLYPRPAWMFGSRPSFEQTDYD